MIWRVIRNRMAVGKPWRTQMGRWVRVGISQRRRFEVAYEEHHDTQAEAERSRLEQMAEGD